MTYSGKITMYDKPRGWGFITRDDGEQVFFHVKNMVPSFLPANGARVLFETGPALKLGQKDQAVNLRDDFAPVADGAR
jgi:cold shock CspA family protein